MLARIMNEIKRHCIRSYYNTSDMLYSIYYNDMKHYTSPQDLFFFVLRTRAVPISYDILIFSDLSYFLKEVS